MNFETNFDWRVKLGIFLVLLSALLYTCHYFIFNDAQGIFFYIGIDIAFLPIEILFVVLLIENAISNREKSLIMEKLNMVIGVFFSEVGTELMGDIIRFDPDTDDIRDELLVTTSWSQKDFKAAKEKVKKFNYVLRINDENKDSIEFLESTKSFLVSKRKFLLALLENPNLLEHETFTDLLWAVFHLMEELEKREDLNHLPPTDYQHLSGDTVRVYSLMTQEWLQYMEHLKNNYPYLFSLAVRTNPFNPQSKVVISDD
jgi:hypothetical protein